LTFDTGSWSEIAPQIIISWSTGTRPVDNPTREGYVFDDWYTTKDENTKFDFNEVLTGNTTAYAHWIQNTRIANCDESTKPANTVVTTWTYIQTRSWGVNDFLPTTKEWTYSGAECWYECATDYEYIGWSCVAKSHTIHFDPNGWAWWPWTWQTVDYWGTGQVPDVSPVMTGYDFIGWYDWTWVDAHKWDFEHDELTGDITLYARYEIWAYYEFNAWTWIFPLNGATLITWHYTRWVKFENSIYAAYGRPAKSWYNFTWWALTW
jgi:uncharacterized repeat protein (TIGR02543 family)